MKPTIFQLPLVFATLLFSAPAFAADPVPIVDVHIHYSHDSVEMTPPETVIELMKKAGLKHALVSSSDDKGTQLLANLAPDLIIPGLRPYRRRGELGTWFTDPEALKYVKDRLAEHRYASIGEFHLFGADVDLPIPREMVRLAKTHNLILHAHSDADAVRRLFKQDPSMKVIWAHSGFDSPEEVAELLGEYPNLWSDLAFRSDMGEGDGVNPRWKKVFEAFPNRFMVGTDTYTPERMYFIPEHAQSSRQWLSALPKELAENIGWRNASELILPVWKANREKPDQPGKRSCAKPGSGANGESSIIAGSQFTVQLTQPAVIRVSEPFAVRVAVCNRKSADTVKLELDAVMPRHGHGMNYRPTIKPLSAANGHVEYEVSGLLMHMPGQWQWQLSLSDSNQRETLKQTITIQ
jgi:hypothetical protein